jgi:hypothetical protein
MKAAYETTIPCCPVPGQLTSIQPPCNIFDLSTWGGILMDFCVNSLAQIGHLMLWSCFLESFLSISGLLQSTYGNYTINTKRATDQARCNLTPEQISLLRVEDTTERKRMLANLLEPIL